MSNVGELARYFSEMLLEELGESVLETVCELNRNNSSVCQSMHYCDSNQIMLTAFLNVIGEELNFRNKEHIDLVNSAWYEAIDNDFFLREAA